MESGKLHITETIVADFTNEEHHGIYRTIPVNYTDEYGNPFNLRFKLIGVTDENGKKHPVASAGKELFSDEMNIKIGDADVWLNGVTTYVIEYEIDRATSYFDDHDELYWNAFTDWQVPVLESTVTVHLPENANAEDMKAACFTGYYGSNESACNAAIVDDKTFMYTSDDLLAPGEGFTIVAGFPKGVVKEVSLLQKVLWFIFDNWALLIPIIVFFFLFFKWWFTGRDPKTADTIIPRYKAPENLTPTEVGTIIDERVDVHDISTVIIDFAVKGYIKIHEIKSKKMVFFDETDYELEILKPYKKADGIKSHEIEILDAVFDGANKTKISDLKYKFYKRLPDIKKKIYGNLVSDGFFAHNPDNIRWIYLGIGLFLTVGPFFMMGLIVVFLGVTFTFSIIASGILFIIFSNFMPRKTLKGARAYFEIKGLEEYIRTAEKDRIKFQSDQNIFFEKLLPYAIVLGLGEKWAEAFKDIYKKPPDWFEGSDMDNFNTYYLVNRLTDFNTRANTAFAASPRSSGGSSAWGGGSGFSGGFSGGGFGGGGGGGW